MNLSLNLLKLSNLSWTYFDIHKENYVDDIIPGPCRAVRVPARPIRGAAPPCIRLATAPTMATSSLNCS